MIRLAFILFVAGLVTHYGYDPLASFWPDPAHAAQAWFYVLRGLLGVVLCLAVLALLPRGALAAAGVCGWIAFEEGETAVCRLAQGIGNEPMAGPWRGLCDAVTGLPVYAISLAAVLAIVLNMAKRNDLGNPS